MVKDKKRTKLIELRKMIGSQTKVANEIGISRQFLGAIENGDRNPTVKLMVRLSKYFNVDEKVLFSDLFFEDKCHETLLKEKRLSI
jgi:DNA-binding XRE family transcriptional regulator